VAGQAAADLWRQFGSNWLGRDRVGGGRGGPPISVLSCAVAVSRRALPALPGKEKPSQAEAAVEVYQRGSAFAGMYIE
jgi:hypothetical protein